MTQQELTIIAGFVEKLCHHLDAIATQIELLRREVCETNHTAAHITTVLQSMKGY